MAYRKSYLHTDRENGTGKEKEVEQFVRRRKVALLTQAGPTHNPAAQKLANKYTKQSQSKASKDKHILITGKEQPYISQSPGKQESCMLPTTGEQGSCMLPTTGKQQSHRMPSSQKSSLVLAGLRIRVS